MIEEELVRLLCNYGVLGIWTITLLWDKIKFQKQMLDILTKLERKIQ